MRKLTSFFIALTALIIAGCAATGADTPLVKYQEVIQFDDSLDKDALFNRTRLWLAETFVDSESVIELEDKEAGDPFVRVRLTITPQQSIDTAKRLNADLKAFVQKLAADDNW